MYNKRLPEIKTVGFFFPVEDHLIKIHDLLFLELTRPSIPDS